ncbi:hypothetical protein OSB04_031259 [Centaurea solstitialis]|uniref:CCHC-type domain-containing protein n=1 Tax=Centaurea solstitialis TaxID=347529 RepID=A0AA38SLB5_9ASTR|nr:hypothetical protein OSB04_031259 [Centaurea solstitialis]
MASTVTSTNNLSLRSILEKDKLTGSNFLDWERNLMIVLRHERKWYVLEEPLGEAPPANAPTAARNAHKKHSDDLLDVACLMLATMSPDLQAGLINTNAYDMIRQLRDMFQTQARTERYDATKAFNECKMVKGTSVSDHVMKMKRHLDHLERLGHPVPLQLATDTILNSLSEDYRPFVVNYNMNNMEKTIAELHSMLKTAELNMGNKNKTKDVLMVKDGGVKKKNGHASTSKGKGPVQAIQSAPKKGKGKGKGKKVKPNKARTENRCFICNEIGHWRQNCPKRHEAVDLPGLQKESDFRQKSFIYTATKESCSLTYSGTGSSYDQLLNNSYKCCRLKVAQIFDRVANIGRDPRLRLLLGKSHNSARGTFAGRSLVDLFSSNQKYIKRNTKYKDTKSKKPNLIIKEKLRAVRWALKKKNEGGLKENQEKVEKYKAEARKFKEEAKRRGLSKEERKKSISAKELWLEKENRSLDMLRQKTKVKWALEGDENSRFFHAVIRTKFRTNELRGLHINTELIKDPSRLKEEVKDFFETKFSSQKKSGVTLRSKKIKLLQDGEAHLLERAFSEEEVVEAIKGCGMNKRRILAERVKKVLARLIGDTQMAFLKGRFILDEVLIAIEALEDLRRLKKKGLLLKVDFDKAYDSVEWDFLLDMMKEMGFGQRWCRWVLACLKSSTVSVQVNGSPTKEFKMGRGLDKATH